MSAQRFDEPQGVVFLGTRATSCNTIEIHVPKPDEDEEFDAWCRWARKVGIETNKLNQRRRQQRLFARRQLRRPPLYHRRTRARSLSTRLSR